VSAGTYAFAVASRSLRIELGEGWTAQIGPAGESVQLVREGASVEGLSFATFSGKGFGSPCAGRGASATIGASPEGFMAYLAARDGISVAGVPAATTLGGQPALSADVTVQPPSACPDQVGDNFLFGVGATGEFHLEPGEQARIWVVEGTGDPLVVVLESLSAEGFAEVLPIADDILGSLTIS
jgi:hypothetical protein